MVEKEPVKISLAEMAEHRSGVLDKASSENLDGSAEPTLDQLSEILFFSPGDGRIWLNDQRVFLMHTETFGYLRKELIESLGLDQARQFLTRLGYVSGARDANIVKRQWPNADLASAFHAGPQLHALEGVVKVTTVKFEFDVAEGAFYAEFLWHDSTEAMEHINHYGHSDDPTCWMQIGYASGYASVFLERLIIYREIFCSGSGPSHCRIIGRPAEEWEEYEEDLRYLGTSSENWREELMPAARPAHRNFSGYPLGSDLHLVSGSAPRFKSALDLLYKVAPTESTIFLQGEIGVGKNLFASTIHKNSGRSGKPFVSLNCSAFQSDMVEVELFGVERGAFTSAIASRAGRIEKASGGTLFLEEIEGLSATAQSKLLRILKEQTFERVGGMKTIKSNIRVIVASSVNLQELVDAGAFRRDLYYKVNVLPIEIPPLRQRRDDIPILMTHFLEHFCQKNRKKLVSFSRRATELLLDFPFAGNVSELQSLIERAVILVPEGEPIDIVHLLTQEEISKLRTFRLNMRNRLKEERRLTGKDRNKEEIVRVDSAQDMEKRDENKDIGLEYYDEYQPQTATSLAKITLEKGVGLLELEEAIYAEALRKANGKISSAARSLGISRAQLDYRIRKTLKS